MSDTEKEGAVPRRYIYKRRPPVAAHKPEEEPRPQGLSSEDLELFRELGPKLSPKGREIINLILKVFDREGSIDISHLLQLVGSFTGQDKSSSSSPLLELLPLLSSLSGNQSLTQGGLAGILSLLASNRSRD